MTFARTALTAAIACLLAAGPASAAEADKKSLADGPAVPVLAWGGVPYDKASSERFAELAGAGFTHNYSGASDAATMQKILDLAHAQGVKQFISYPELESDPDAAVRRFKDHPGNGGYYLLDEPGANQFAKLAAWTKRIQAVDNVHPCYVNLLPTYGNGGMWNTPTYQTYVDRFVAEVPTPMLSFDHYPIHREGKDASGDHVRGDFYYNLEVCSAAARKTGRPLWAFVLATAHNPYPVAEVNHMRLQAFSDLAYGTSHPVLHLLDTEEHRVELPPGAHRDGRLAHADVRPRETGERRDPGPARRVHREQGGVGGAHGGGHPDRHVPFFAGRAGDVFGDRRYGGPHIAAGERESPFSGRGESRSEQTDAAGRLV